MTKISLSMIVKNEEDVLKRCLDSAAGFADEIVVVDTGSSDATADIARTFTDKVYSYKWNDDFAAARNYSFSLASGDFVMWLDADDVVRESEAAKINAWKGSPDADTLYCLYDAAFDEAGRPTFTFYRERILRRCPLAVWNGFIHECIRPFGKVVKSDIRIEHRPLPGKNKAPDRNLNIYRANIMRGAKLDARDRFYYGRELIYNGFIEEGICMIESMLSAKDAFYINRIEGLKTIAEAKLKQGDASGAKKAYLRSFEYGAPRAWALNGLGRIARAGNDLGEAVLWFKAALEAADHTAEGEFERKEERTVIPYIELCRCYWEAGRRDDALRMHAAAKAAAPFDPYVRYNDRFFGGGGE